MKKIMAAFLISTALVAPQSAFARPVQVTAQLKGYPGPAAYIGVYLVKPDGSFHSSIAVAGQKQKYQAHLRGWYRGVSRVGRIDGITGASVGGGRTLKVTADIADALIDAGYKIQVDTAVEDVGEYRSEASVSLDVTKKTNSAPGRGFIKSLTVKM